MNRIHTNSIIPEQISSSGIETFADLFCGIGGFHYAASQLGLRCVFASEIDEATSAQYEHNCGIKPLGDLTLIKEHNVPDHDILFAGFPCQPFSIIGDMRGTKDVRGVLFLEILRILEEKRPKAVILENVRQFASIAQGKTLAQVLVGLNELGYDSTWKILNALYFGLPQKRERIIIVGMQDGIDKFEWPKTKVPMIPLTDILETKPDKRHNVSDRIRQKRKENHTPKQTPSIWHENKGGNISSHSYSCALRAGASYNYLLVNGERRLTPREQLRLQGFPESFEVIGSDGAIRKQTGNAVPVPMVRAVIKEVLDAYCKNQRRSPNTRAIPIEPVYAINN